MMIYRPGSIVYDGSMILLRKELRILDSTRDGFESLSYPAWICGLFSVARRECKRSEEKGTQ